MGLTPCHIQALANILRRPIILFDGDDQGHGESTAVYLPFFHEPAQCKSRSPIGIAWQSSTHNHFVALVPIKRVEQRTRIAKCVSTALALDNIVDGESFDVPDTHEPIDVTVVETGVERPCYLDFDMLPKDRFTGRVKIFARGALLYALAGGEDVDDIEILSRYIDFEEGPAGGKRFVLGGGVHKSMERYFTLMDQKFTELNGFTTAHAREVSCMYGYSTLSTSTCRRYWHCKRSKRCLLMQMADLRICSACRLR